MQKMYDVIIIGAGPAGLSAAIYAVRARLETVLIEAAYVSGGQIVNTYEVDNYPGLPGVSGMELAQKFREHAEQVGVEFVRQEVKELTVDQKLKTVRTQESVYQAKCVIVATGAHHRLLGVEGEAELTGMGLSYCATCDGAFFKDRTVAVVGGGDVAIEDAIFLARGCKKVYVVHRRDELRAAKALQEKLFSLENVEMKWNLVPEGIVGDELVKGVLVRDVKTGETGVLDVDGVFVAVGIEPNSGMFREMLEVDVGGYVVAGEDCKTSVPGVFAVGDVRTKNLRQIITAAADGANAVTSVQEYLL